MTLKPSRSYIAIGKCGEDIKANEETYKQGVLVAHPELDDRVLKIIPEKKAMFLKSIDELTQPYRTNDADYSHAMTFKQALFEAAFFFYDSHEPNQVKVIAKDFAKTIDARSLSESLKAHMKGQFFKG